MYNELVVGGRSVQGDKSSLNSTLTRGLVMYVVDLGEEVSQFKLVKKNVVSSGRREI